jgi:hypothetical protein
MKRARPPSGWLPGDGIVTSVLPRSSVGSSGALEHRTARDPRLRSTSSSRVTGGAAAIPPRLPGRAVRRQRARLAATRLASRALVRRRCLLRQCPDPNCRDWALASEARLRAVWRHPGRFGMDGRRGAAHYASLKTLARQRQVATSPQDAGPLPAQGPVCDLRCNMSEGSSGSEYVRR